MKTWYIDFSGYCEIEAETESDAEDIFWKLLNKYAPFPNEVFDIDTIEEKKD